MKNFIIKTLLLLSTIYTAANNAPLIENQELPWNTVLDGIAQASAIVSTGATELSQHLREKYLNQKPILITKTVSEEMITHTFNVFYTTPFNIEIQKTLLTIEYNIKDGTVQFKDHLLGLIGLNCSANLPQDINSSTLKASVNFEIESSKVMDFLKSLGLAYKI